MAIRNTFIACLIPYLAATTGLHAQDTSASFSGIRFTLQQCIDYAKIHSFEINTNRLTAQTSQENLALSKASRLPSLSGSATQNANHGKNFNALTGNLQDQTIATGNYSVGSTVTLYNGSYINNDIKQKGLQVQLSSLSILQGENDITLQITQAFLNILLAKENIVYLKDLVTTSMAEVKQEQLLYDAGSVAKTQLIALQAQYATDKYNLVTGQNIYRQNIFTLKQILLLPVDSTFDISGPDSVAVQRLYPALHDAVTAALQTRPEVKTGLLNVQISELELEKAKAGGRPLLNASGTISSGYSTQSGEFFRQLDDNFFQQLGLSLSVPIFTKRVTKTAVENSKIAIAQAEVSLENTKTVLSQQVEQAFINIQNSEAQYDAAVEQLKSAQEAYRIAGEELKLGAIDAVAMLVQKNQYIQALQAYEQAKYNTVLFIKIYDFYMGNPVTL